MRMMRPALCDAFIVSCAVVNAILFLTHCWHAFSPNTSVPSKEAHEYHYTYIGDDYPEHLPLPSPPSPSSHVYDLAATSFPISGPSAAEQWDSIYPPGHGFVRMGDQARLLCIALFHQLHCIEKMRIYLDDPTGAGQKVSWPHQQHCMNYLRQSVLCRADRTLEPFIPDFESDFERQLTERPDGLKDFTPEFARQMETRSGEAVERECGDARALFDFAGENYVEWKRGWNISSPWDVGKGEDKHGHSHGLRSEIV